MVGLERAGLAVHMKTTGKTKKTDVSVATKAASKDTCTHHWVIEPPNGAVSVGKCRHCGERREFRNSYEYSSWYGTKNTDKPAS